jgi:6-pyruvoyltetrahydropterin/6-carboxytetrahydropterin synthase
MVEPVKLTRRYRFAASHRLNTEALSPEGNARLYGKCNNPYGHGHDYVLDVTVTGKPDAAGQVVRRADLDEIVHRQVLARLEHRNLNVEVPELAGKVTTTENLAMAVEKMLLENWQLPAKLAGVRISETPRNTFELETE